MEINEYFNQKRNIYNHILAFIESEDEIEENFACLSDYLESNKFFENESEPMTIFNILLNICNDHHRTQNFFYKIDKILNLILSKQTMSKPNISQIIKNKHIFLFLVQKKIIKLNKYTIDYLISTKQHLFYIDEIKPLLNDKMLQSIEKGISELDQDIFLNFENKRKIGESDSYICELIRNDMIQEFIIYINRTNIPLSSTIILSIYETNPFLIGKNSTIIEYSAFFGSIQIFRYLLFNGVELTPSLWLYSIHSNNPDLIHLLEENHVKPPNDSFEICFEESIKCHHNNMANYFMDNYLINTNEMDFEHNSIRYSFLYNNFYFFSNDFENDFIFLYACQYNYLNLFKLLLNVESLNINKVII